MKFYSTWQIFGGGALSKSMQMSKKRIETVGNLVCRNLLGNFPKSTNSVQILFFSLRSRKEKNLYRHCAINNARRILSKGPRLLRSSCFGSKKLHFQKNFGRNFNAEERITLRKTAGKWQKCNLVSGMASVASDMGWLWTGWIGPAPVQMSGMLSVLRAFVIVCELLQGLVVFFIDLLFLREESPWSFSGLDSCVLAYCNSAVPLLSPQSFYNYARGHCEVAQASNCSGVCWEEGMGDGGVLVLQDVGTMKSLHWRCEMWLDCVEQKRSAKLPWSVTTPCTFAAAPSFQACLRAFRVAPGMLACVWYVHFVCVCA